MYRLTNSNAECVYIASSIEKVELYFPWIFYLQRVAKQTKIVGWKKQYIVNASLQTIAGLLKAKEFVQVSDDYIVGRDHVSSFVHGIVKVGNDFVDTDPKYSVTAADFPWVAGKEIVM